MSDTVLEVSDATFDAEVLKSDLPVLVDMWAPWCGPCRMVAPTIEELGRDNAGKIKICKVDVDESPQCATRYGVNTIPTVLFFKNGEEVQQLRMMGAQPKSAYQAGIDEVTGA